MKTNELITELRTVAKAVAPPARELLIAAAEELERLGAELVDERYRHDRYVDFELAQAKELESYREAEKTGLLLRLPCPIGSKIYILARRKDGGGHIYTKTLMGAHLRDEHSRRCLRRKEYIVVRGGEGFSNHLDMDKQGIVWFTDYEAAKSALDAPAGAAKKWRK